MEIGKGDVVNMDENTRGSCGMISR